MNRLHESFTARFGIFARTFARNGLGPTLDAVREHCRVVQWNLSCAGLPTLPDRIEAAQVEAIADALRGRRLKLAAVSGTFNMIDPDAGRRAENLRRLGVLAAHCRAMGTSVITLCTGTRDPDDMWRAHPDNDSPSAWDDLLASMRAATGIAGLHGVILAFEPEFGNVVNTAAKARELLDEIGSPHLKVVLDPANLIGHGNLHRMGEVIDEAFRLLAPDVAILHVKEIAADGSMGAVAPGRGVVDFPRVFRRYFEAGMNAPIILHGLRENDVESAHSKLWKDFSLAAMTGRFEHDGLAFRYLDSGEGLPFVFQHGLSGDVTKVQELFDRVPDGVRLIAFDARYHGETRPFRDPSKISFHQSSEDLAALLDHLGIERAVIGGLSMGAGIALHFGLRFPARTLGLVLSRPAWVDEPLPENVKMFPLMADLVRNLGPTEALAAFRDSPLYADIARRSSDSAATLLGMFESPIFVETIDRFDRIPRDCPSTNRDDWRSIAVPTLVLANHLDPIHPHEIGATLAATIPGAELQTLTPKCESVQGHNRDFQRHVTAFLQRHFLPS